MCVCVCALVIDMLCVCVGVNGYDGDGDITKPENLVAFQEYVMEQTEGNGVHFVMGDGVSSTLNHHTYL